MYANRMFADTLTNMRTHLEAGLQWMQQSEWPFYYSVVCFRPLRFHFFLWSLERTSTGDSHSHAQVTDEFYGDY